MIDKRRLSFAAAVGAALMLFATNASATLLPLDACVGNSCNWFGANFPIIEADPTTGDVWIKFESAPGAGDKGHIEANPLDEWNIFFGNNSVTGISFLFGVPFLTDMDQSLMFPETNIIYPLVDDDIGFNVLFLESAFVHNLHWPCVASPMECITAIEMAAGGLEIQSLTGDIVTGIWEAPEPGTLALLGLGLAGLGAVRRVGKNFLSRLP